MSASYEEIDWWEAHRPDIARYVRDGKIWVDPASGEYFARCPWLRDSSDGNGTVCDIYHERPEDCRHYPVDIEQMVRHGCQMLETRDLNDIKSAQKKLDFLMADTRPPVVQ